MRRILMNGDTPVLDFDLEEHDFKVLNNQFLPFPLKDFIRDIEGCTSLKEAQTYMEVFREYLAFRTLNLSRENAKAILHSAGLNQSSTTEGRIGIVLACRGLNMGDNIWIREADEDICFQDVNLRKRRLSEASYEVAILGHHIPATSHDLASDLTTGGMFPKFWKQDEGGIYLYKTDTHSEHPHTYAEIKSSDILMEAGVNAIPYTLSEINGCPFAVSKCISDDTFSMVEAFDVKNYCRHKGMDFLLFVREKYLEQFANMCICDYVIANTDRHFNNFAFLINNSTNEIYSFAPLYDHNQSLITDEFGTCIDDLLYEPTGKTFMETVREYAPYSTVSFSGVGMSEQCKERWKTVEQTAQSL